MIKRRYILLLDAAVLIGLLLGVLIISWMQANITPCVFTHFGLLCPACGGTRCLRYLLQGQLQQAFLMNPYLFCTAFLALILVLLLNMAVLTQKHYGMSLVRLICKPRWLIAWAVGFALFGILRNI